MRRILVIGNTGGDAYWDSAASDREIAAFHRSLTCEHGSARKAAR